jgi:hypothetical protein
VPGAEKWFQILTVVCNSLCFSFLFDKMKL